MEELIINNVTYELDKRIIRGVKNNDSLNLLLLLDKYYKYSILHNLKSDIVSISSLILKLKYNCLCS